MKVYSFKSLLTTLFILCLSLQINIAIANDVLIIAQANKVVSEDKVKSKNTTISNKKVMSNKNESMKVKKAIVRDEKPESLSICACLKKPAEIPKTDKDFYCCNDLILTDLAKSKYNPDKPEFNKAVLNAKLLISGLENVIIDTFISESSEKHIKTLEYTALLRINTDRIMLLRSPKLRIILSESDNKAAIENNLSKIAP